ncbi:MAG: hypothetical protein U9N35_03285, partial [Euryarchaeota archaeon]|nr:hypothetical protein [Euryarchaeota archaeon]
RGNESLNRMKEMKYKHAAIEFVAYEEEFKYEMALELNGHCQLDGEKVKRKKDISEKKLDREELLKKYRIRDPSDETVIELIGGRGEELLEFENRMKSKVLNNVQDFLCAKTLFMEISLTGFEAFLRGGILNSNIGVFARCIVYREAPEKARDRLNVGIKKAIKKSFDEEIGDNYKLNVNLNNKLRIREAMTGSSEEEREAETREYSIKSTL